MFIFDRAGMQLVVLEISIISERQAKSVILMINTMRERERERNEIEGGQENRREGLTLSEPFGDRNKNKREAT